MRTLTANSLAEAYRIDGGRDLLNVAGVRGVTAIDIRVLGPVEFDGPAGPAALGGPRQRALFGLLALRAPKVVSQDALLDGIWGEDPPPSGIRNLHAHVAYLRRALAKAGADGLIVTRPPGYALLVDPGVVDLHRFADLTQRTGEPDALREALALWRGDPFAGCPVQEWADAEVARLREARLAAIEALAAAEITAGRGGPMIAELESLVANHPLRERFWELLMLALAREDRQGDALRVYQRARSTLIEELGVEPGHRLRQLEAAVHRGGMGAPEQPADTSVPAPLTSLVGRETEIAELTGRLITHRLVTLTGVGGSGKTRLAVEICAAYPGDVRFVDLTPVRDDVADALCAKLGLREESGAVDTLVRHLRPQATLLVLDNCEHLIAACSALAERLLRACPKLRILATSRESLGVLGEVAWPVSGLAVPPAGASNLAEARRYDAVRLFLDRAAVPAVRALTDADAHALTEICRRLDGLPLAVELAAARTSVLTVAEIAARIHDPALLRDGGRQSRPHHRALDATVAFSYELLGPEMRALFRMLAVFVGGFTLEAACALRPNALEPLADLATKSLVVVERDHDGTRYRLLETIRQFAVERLAEHPDEAARARAAHAAHFLALAEETDRRLRGPGQQAAMDRCTAEGENLAAAKEWFAEHDRVAGLRLAVALARFHRLRGAYEKGRVWLDDALAGTDGGPLAAAALLAAAFLAFFELAYRQAAAHAERALAEFHEAADHAGEGRALRLLGSIARVRGEYEQALAWYDKAQANYGPSDEHGIADVRQMAGFTAWLSGDLDRAERLLDQALLCYQSTEDTESAASTRIHLAMVAFHHGELARARTLAEDALTTFTEFGFQEGIAWSYNVLGLVALRTGAGADAVLKLHASLDIHCQLGDRWRQPSLVDALAAAALEAGDASRAAALIGLADQLRDVPGIPVPVQEAALRADTIERTRLALGEERYYESYSDGRRIHPEDIARADVLPRSGTAQEG